MYGVRNPTDFMMVSGDELKNRILKYRFKSSKCLEPLSVCIDVMQIVDNSELQELMTWACDVKNASIYVDTPDGVYAHHNGASYHTPLKTLSTDPKNIIALTYLLLSGNEYYIDENIIDVVDESFSKRIQIIKNLLSDE